MSGSADDLATRLARLAGVRVLCVGDLMVDRFVYGEVSRVSPEAPVPILAHARESAMLGGAGNVARNVAALGGAAALVGAIGDDASGHDAQRLVEAVGEIEGSLVTDVLRPTTVKTRFAAAGQQLLRLDRESGEPLAGEPEAELCRAVAEAAGGARAILLSDYGKGVATPKVIAACRRAASESGAPLIVDSKARGFAHYGAVDLVKPNAGELSRAVDLPTDTDEEIEAALAAALAACEAGAILVTRAAKGMSLAVRGAPVLHVSRPPPEVFDTAGAGDTALAATGLALAAGLPLEAAVDLALLACSVVVRKAGVASTTPQEMIDADWVDTASPHEAKVVSKHRMAAERERWRERGLKAGFTNGCFDILHPGHIAYLSQARSWCDRLIVGLNSDRSVRAGKGEGRPVNDAASRAAVLAALACVDLVVVFDEATPIDLIEAARPDLLVKGGDYRLDQVVGADLVTSLGGEVRLAPFIEGHSTTATLKRAGASG